MASARIMEMSITWSGNKEGAVNRTSPDALSIQKKTQQCCFLTCILEQCFIFSSWGIVLVTTTASKQALLMREIAGPEKMPWVKMAYTLVAPAEISLNTETQCEASHIST